MRLISELILDSSGVLQIRHGLTNLRATPWQVDRTAITLPVAERALEVMAFHGRWTREFQPHRVRLEHDSFVLENRRGRTSHEHFPAMIAGTVALKLSNKAMCGACIWAGAVITDYAAVKTDGRRYLQAELYLAGKWR